MSDDEFLKKLYDIAKKRTALNQRRMRELVEADQVRADADKQIRDFERAARIAAKALSDNGVACEVKSGDPESGLPYSFTVRFPSHKLAHDSAFGMDTDPRVTY